MTIRFFSRLILSLVAVVLTSGTDALAQGRFSPVVQVGDKTVTRYELDQRTRFLSLLGAPGDPRDLAREQLINEAVQISAAEKAGLEISADEVRGGMEEFASRANLTAEQLVTSLGQAGVDAETFRDFIGAGVAWRNYVRESFGENARNQVPGDLVARTLAQTGTEGGLRVLISEILLPATTPETTQASRLRAGQLSSLGSEEAFAAAAREVSVAPSAPVGGALNWVALDTLPDELRGIVSQMTPGQISRPVNLENSIGVFLLRDVERVAAGTPETLLIDYALFIAGGERAAAEAVAAEIDVCDDLFGVAQTLPEERLIREEVSVAALPADIRSELARLDENETSTALTRGGQPTVLMLCARKPALESTVDLAIIGNRLLNARLGTMAADHLADLRANTIVVDLVN
ncbi:MAG: peptidylprolyl isomerase [Silicimonas sp.]|nr:peptidylprolyl isomerase [Silicimonas sp.]